MVIDARGSLGRDRVASWWSADPAGGQAPPHLGLQRLQLERLTFVAAPELALPEVLAVVLHDLQQFRSHVALVDHRVDVG